MYVPTIFKLKGKQLNYQILFIFPKQKETFAGKH